MTTAIKLGDLLRFFAATGYKPELDRLGRPA